MVVRRLATPIAMGGKGKGANPEQLFAAGYAACFNSSIEHVATKAKVAIGPITVPADIGLGLGPAGEAYALTTKLTVRIGGVIRELAKTLVQKAHMVSPYSNATCENVDVVLAVAE